MPGSASRWRSIGLTLTAALLFAALAATAYASVRHARAAADYVRRYHDHTVLPGGAGLARFGFDRLADRLKRLAVGASTRKLEAWKTRAELLEAWREWHETRARRGALLAGGIAALFVGVMAWRDGRARGGALGTLGASLVALAAGITAPCLSFSAALSDIPVLGPVTIKTAVSGIPDSLEHLWQRGHAVLAALLFLFSILFPFAKTAFMAAAAFGAGCGGGWWSHAHEWAKKLGKWSMTDVMVVALLFVQLSAGEGGMTSARLEIGAYYFCAHVVLALVAGALLGRVRVPMAADAEPEPAPAVTAPAGLPAWKRRITVAATALALVLAAGGSLYVAWRSCRGLTPGHGLAWTMEGVEPQSAFWRRQPFALRLTPSGTPGLTDVVLALTTPDGKTAELAIPDWPAGTTQEVSVPGQQVRPVSVDIRLVSPEAGERVWSWKTAGIPESSTRGHSRL